MDALNQITEGMTGQEVAQIIYQNDSNSLTDYIVSYLHPTEGVNGTNVYTLTTAIAKIPQDIRKQGITCTFLSINGWLSYKYIGNTIINDNWNTTSNWILIATEKELSNLATQNSMMHLIGSNKTVNVSFDEANTSVTISLPSGLFLSYGNIRIADSATSNGQVITDPMTDNRYKYLIYNLTTSKYELVLQTAQMNNSVLVGWINQYTKTAVLLCDNYTVNRLPGTASEIAKLTYDSIPTTVIQLKKYADDGYALLQLVSSIDTEVKITGGYASFNDVDFTETSIGIKKETLTNLYFKCVESYAIIEAKGVYNITVGSNLTYNYISQNIKDFGNSLTQLSLSYNNNIYGEIKDFNRYITYVSIGEGTTSKPNISGNFKDLPRLLTYLKLRSNTINISGDVADLPRKLKYLYLQAGVSSETTGNVADLPRGLTDIKLYNLVEGFTGDIKEFPLNLTSILMAGTNFNISGDIKNAPSNLLTLQISGNSTITGNIADIPRTIKTITLNQNSNIYGNLSEMPPTTGYFILYSKKDGEKITGDIGDIPNKSVVNVALYGNIDITFDKEFPLSSGFYGFRLYPDTNFPIDSSTIDKILITLNAKAEIITGTGFIDLLGSCATPTGASQSAITSLQEKGFTIQTN